LQFIYSKNALRSDRDMNCVILALGRKTASLHHALDKTVSRFQTLQILTLVPLLNPAMTLFTDYPNNLSLLHAQLLPIPQHCSWVRGVHPLQAVGECLLTHGLEQRRLSLLRDLFTQPYIHQIAIFINASNSTTCPSLGHRFHRQTKSCQLFLASLAIAQQYFAKAFFPIAYFHA